MLKNLFSPLTYLATIALSVIIAFSSCEKKDKDPEIKRRETLSAIINEAVKESVEELPEVELVDHDLNFVSAKDTADQEKVICEVFLSKKDPAATHSFTDYTDKLIKLRVMSKVKEKLLEEKIKTPAYFNIVFLSRN